jgi:hypothetical protein
MTNFSKQKQSKNKKRIRLNLKIFNKALLILIIILGVYYIAGINDLTVKGFELQELKVGAMDIGDKNSSLELQTMSLGAYNNLSERINKLDMVAVGHVEYISGINSSVAKK